jgi:hypothetical protein
MRKNAEAVAQEVSKRTRRHNENDPTCAYLARRVQGRAEAAKKATQHVQKHK